jgi:hypothetical protein
MRLIVSKLGVWLRLVLLTVLMAGQSLASAHELSHHLEGTAPSHGAECGICSIAGALDDVLDEQAVPATAPGHTPAGSIRTPAAAPRPYDGTPQPRAPPTHDC